MVTYLSSLGHRWVTSDKASRFQVVVEGGLGTTELPDDHIITQVHGNTVITLAVSGLHCFEMHW